MTYKKVACKWCGQPVSANAINRHQKKCEKSSEAERLVRFQARQWQAHRAKKNGGYDSSTRSPKRNALVPKRHYTRRAHLLNGNGRRLSATISVDLKTLRTLILELAPSLSIDRVEVL